MVWLSPSRKVVMAILKRLLRRLIAIKMNLGRKLGNSHLTRGIFRMEDFVEPMCIGPLDELVERTAYYANQIIIKKGFRVILFILFIKLWRVLRWPFYNPPEIPKPLPEEYFRASQLMTKQGLKVLKERR